jgi:hypothetical protein
VSEILDLIAVLGAVDDAATGRPPRVADAEAGTGAPEPAGDAPESPDGPESPPSGSAPGPQSQGPITTAAPESERRQREQRRQLKRLVPVYDDPDSFGWYDTFSVREGNVAPSVRDALTNLAEPTRSPAMLPRRLVAVALAARAFPERFGPVGAEAEVALDALTIPGIIKGLPPVLPPLPSAGDEPDGDDGNGKDGNGNGNGGNYAEAEPEIQQRAWALLSALADPNELRRIEDWRRFLDRYDHLVNPQLFNLPAPCSTRIMKREDGGTGTTLLQTDLCLAGADVATVAARFLDWTRWKECNPWWCEMAAAGASGDLPRYLERVASACPIDGTPAVFDVAVFLDFARIDKGADRQLLTYKMSASQETTAVQADRLKANDAVTVDEGVIEVRRDGDHLRVSTTKRVRFKDLHASVVAVLACWVGYGDLGAEMILNCTAGTVRAVQCGGATGAASPGLVSDILALAHEFVADAAAEAHRVIDRAGSGTYGVGDAAEDATSSMKLAVRGWQNLATTVLQQPGAASEEKAAAPADEQSVRSRMFSFDPPLPADCSLVLSEKLTSRHKDEAPVAKVTIVPTELKDGERRFRLDVKSKDLAGTFFEGQVEARDPETDLVVAVAAVDVIVP